MHTRKGKVAILRTVQYDKNTVQKRRIGNSQLKVGGCLVADLQCHQFDFQRQSRPYLEASGESQMQMRRELFSAAHAHCFPREQPGRVGIFWVCPLLQGTFLYFEPSNCVTRPLFRSLRPAVVFFRWSVVQTAVDELRLEPQCRTIASLLLRVANREKRPTRRDHGNK